MKLSVLVLSTALLYSCSQVQKPKGVQLTILHTNDHHGRFWANNDGEYGLAARSTLIKQLRAEIEKKGGHVLLIDAGDVNTGVPQSDMLDAEPDFKGMAALGYDVMAIGNHEFDQPLHTIHKQQKEWAKFPFVSANIYKGKERVFPSHVTKKIDGITVTVFGLTTEDTPKKANPKNSKGLTFVPAVEEAKKLVPLLRPKTDVLIALTHIGHYPDETHGNDSPGDVTLARQVNGIDVIVGGHTQKPMFEPDIQNGAIIVQAYEWGKYVGRIDLEVLDGKVELKDYKLIPVNLKDSKEKIKDDEQMLALLKPFKDQGDKSLLVEIGRVDKELLGRREVVRLQETSLGNFVAEAYRTKFNADLAILNSGGLRDSIYPGKITIETTQTVLPFAGEVVTAEFTGAELKKYLEFVAVNMNPGSGSFPQISGAKIIIDNATKKLKSLRVQGKPVSDARKYLVALPEFIANGGDKFPVVKYRKFGFVDATLLKEYIRKKKNIEARHYAPTGDIKFE